MEWAEAVKHAEEIIKDLVDIYVDEGFDGVLDMILDLWREQRYTGDGWITIEYNILFGYIINTPYYIWITEKDVGVEIGGVFVSLKDTKVDAETRKKFKELCNQLWNFLSNYS